MNPLEFVNKWKAVEVKEIAFAQSHFNDVCELVGVPKPLEIDPHGTFFTFEISAKKFGSRSGRADVWYKGKFIWEYKGDKTDLEEAYQQLQLYRESLENPPLLITSNAHTIIINTNFNNTVRKTYVLTLDDLLIPSKLDLLKKAFTDPEWLKPKVTQEEVTRNSANAFVLIADDLLKWDQYDKNFLNAEALAHFIVQLLFCLFAEDIGLLPNNVFSETVGYVDKNFGTLQTRLQNLFEHMKNGGLFGNHKIPYIDGTLFDNIIVPEAINTLSSRLEDVGKLDWSGIDPSIFGTLFERVIDKNKRAQLGAHYTSKDDILLVVNPVLMQSLRDEWIEIRRQVHQLIDQNCLKDASLKLKEFSGRISSIKVLDPACGSGNFLYVALRQLLDLQKEIIVISKQNNLEELPLTVGPHQLYGIELDSYAHQLAQIVIWIGYIQWRFENGFSEFEEPVLKPLHQILHQDAIIKLDGNNIPIEPTWPETDVIIGNPPFLGSRKMRPLLGSTYCDNLVTLYKKDLKGMPDLVCYWFNKSLKLVETGEVKNVGLLATQAIRGGTNSQVLDNIVNNGEIFMAWSDKDWVLDGAHVHVSIVGFNKGNNRVKYLDGKIVNTINSHLDAGIDLSTAAQLIENEGISFQGVVLRGKFNITDSEAHTMLNDSNPTDVSNSEVIKKRKTGADVLSKSPDSYIIDFGIDRTEESSSSYILPFQYLLNNVKPDRQKALQKSAQEKWWLHWNPRVQMKERLSKLSRYVATPRVAKHRVFVWLDKDIVPDAQLIVFARDDDYFMGVLHSKIHEVWARKKGTQLRDAVSGFRYTPKSVFRNFPFPLPLGTESQDETFVVDISNMSKSLMSFREKWLYPEGVGITFSKSDYIKRNLTNLYNALEFYRLEIKGKQRDLKLWNKTIGERIVSLEEIEELDRIHDDLDSSVIRAYGWEINLDNEEILTNLLTLNQRRPHSASDESDESDEESDE